MLQSLILVLGGLHQLPGSSSHHDVLVPLHGDSQPCRAAELVIHCSAVAAFVVFPLIWAFSGVPSLVTGKGLWPEIIEISDDDVSCQDQRRVYCCSSGSAVDTQLMNGGAYDVAADSIACSWSSEQGGQLGGCYGGAAGNHHE